MYNALYVCMYNVLLCMYNALYVCVCASHHFRACLSAVLGSADSDRIVTVDGGGLGSTVLALTAPYRRLRRPIWPLDQDQEQEQEEEEEEEREGKDSQAQAGTDR